MLASGLLLSCGNPLLHNYLRKGMWGMMSGVRSARPKMVTKLLQLPARRAVPRSGSLARGIPGHEGGLANNSTFLVLYVSNQVERLYL